MAKNKMSDLRDHLFETIEALKDPDKPMDVARAKAVSDVAQTIINAAKVELEAYDQFGEGKAVSDFLALDGERKPPQLVGKVGA